MGKKILDCLLSVGTVIIGYFVASIGGVLMMLLLSFLSIYNDTVFVSLMSLSTCFCLILYYFCLRKIKRYKTLVLINKIYIVFCIVVVTILFAFTQGSLLGPARVATTILTIPFLPLIFIFSLGFDAYAYMLSMWVILFVLLVYLTLTNKNKKEWVYSLICLLCVGVCSVTYINSPNYKYRKQGHNFEYLSGFSSIDLSDYAPYSDSGKLVTLDHPAELWIEDPNEMPILDGAEACYPVYSAIAKAIYKDIDKLELDYAKNTHRDNGEIVTFYNTAVGFERLIWGDVDLFFGAKPSKSQLELAEEQGVELVYTPIGKEAFVFFVNEENPIEKLSADEIRSIYHGDIKNWKQLGGNNEEIVAFQRPERSGSQSMMVHFMGDVELKEPLTYEMEYAMMGIVKEVAEYHNESGAIGYSFRYYLEGMTQVEGVKMLSVDDVYPNKETIQDGSYPVVTSLYCISVKGNDNPNVQKVIDFLLSEDGQYIIEQTGYVPLY